MCEKRGGDEKLKEDSQRWFWAIIVTMGLIILAVIAQIIQHHELNCPRPMTIALEDGVLFARTVDSSTFLFEESTNSWREIPYRPLLVTTSEFGYRREGFRIIGPNGSYLPQICYK